MILRNQNGHRFWPAVVLAALLTGLHTPARAQFRPGPPPAPLGPWMDRSLSPDRRADLVLAQMTLEEKISLVHGSGFPGFGPPADPAAAAVLARSNGGAGIVPGIPRLGIPDLNMADSAVGVTRGALRSRYSTALPSAIALAASWDPELAYDYWSADRPRAAGPGLQRLTRRRRQHHARAAQRPQF